MPASETNRLPLKRVFFIKRLKKQIVWLKNEQVVTLLKFCYEAQPRFENEQK